MPLLIDAYNVINASGVLPPEIAGLEVDGLIDLIADSRFARRHAVIICDGRPRRDAPAGHFGRISVVYSGSDESADDLAATMITKTSAPGRLVVVTSDRDLQRIAARRGCQVLGSDAFLTQLADDWQRRFKRGRKRPGRKPRAPLTPAEIDYWLSIFGLADREAADLFVGQQPTEAEVEAIDMQQILKETDPDSESEKS